MIIKKSDCKVRYIDKFSLKAAIFVSAILTYGYYTFINNFSISQLTPISIIKIAIVSFLPITAWVFLILKLFDSQQKDRKKAKQNIKSVIKTLEEKFTHTLTMAAEFKTNSENLPAPIGQINVLEHTSWNNGKTTVQILYGSLGKNDSFVPCMAEHLSNINSKINYHDGLLLIIDQNDNDYSNKISALKNGYIEILAEISSLLFAFKYLDDFFNHGGKSFFYLDKIAEIKGSKEIGCLGLFTKYSMAWREFFLNAVNSKNLNSNEIGSLVSQHTKNPYYPYYPAINPFYEHQCSGRIINGVWFPNFFANQILESFARHQR